MSVVSATIPAGETVGGSIPAPAMQNIGNVNNRTFFTFFLKN